MRVILDRWQELTFVSDGPWLADRMLNMSGTFRAVPLDGKRTRITHEYTFAFKGPLAKLLEWYSRSWLASDVATELERLRDHFATREQQT